LPDLQRGQLAQRLQRRGLGLHPALAGTVVGPTLGRVPEAGLLADRRMTEIAAGGLVDVQPGPEVLGIEASDDLPASDLVHPVGVELVALEHDRAGPADRNPLGAEEPEAALRLGRPADR